MSLSWLTGPLNLISYRSAGLSSGVKFCRPPGPGGRGLLLGETTETHQPGPHRPGTPAVNSHPSRSVAAVLALSRGRVRPLSSGLAEPAVTGESVIGTKF